MKAIGTPYASTGLGALVPRILLIDDDLPTREAVAELLKLDGHEVTEASHGLEGLALLGQGYRADVILLDLYMPVMNGAQFVSALEKSDMSRAPVVVFSAEAYRAPKSPLVVAALSKVAIDAEDLWSAIRSAVRRRPTEP